MTIADWVNKREMTGLPTFSFKDVCGAFPLMSIQVVKNNLHRLLKSHRIQSVHKGFYTAVPLQYREKGIVTPYNYIGQLMAYLNRPYYIGLLSAGVLNGAAHQRPQKLSVVTIPPRISLTETSNSQLDWNYRQAIPSEFLLKTNSDTGPILYSNPELTAIDLIQFSHLVGGLSVSATVLAELVEKTDFSNYGENLLEITSLATIQRLGYILENIIEAENQADSIYNIIEPHTKQLRYRPLSTSHPTEDAERDKKWKIIINQEIDPDDIW